MFKTYNITLFSAVQMLKGMKSLVFPKGSQTQTLCDGDFAAIAVASLSIRTCEWTVMEASGGERMSSFPAFPFI